MLQAKFKYCFIKTEECIYIYIYIYIFSDLSKAVRIFIEIVTSKYPSTDQGKVYLWKPQTEKGSVNFCRQFYTGITKTLRSVSLFNDSV